MQSAKTIRVLAAAEAGIEDGRNAVIARISQVTGIDMNGWSLTTDLDYKDTDCTLRLHGDFCPSPVALTHRRIHQ